MQNKFPFSAIFSGQQNHLSKHTHSQTRALRTTIWNSSVVVSAIWANFLLHFSSCALKKMHWPARQVPKITEICSTSAAWSVFCGWKKGTANSCIVSELISREIRTNVFILYYHNIHVKFGENLECVCYLYAGVVVVDKHRAYFVSPALFYSSPYITIRDMNMIAYWAWISMLSKLTRTRMFKVWKWNCERATAAAVNLYIAFCERHQWSKCRNNFQIRPTHIIIRREKKSNYHRVLVALTLSLLLYLPPHSRVTRQSCLFVDIFYSMNSRIYTQNGKNNNMIRVYKHNFRWHFFVATTTIIAAVHFRYCYRCEPFFFCDRQYEMGTLRKCSLVLFSVAVFSFLRFFFFFFYFA